MLGRGSRWLGALILTVCTAAGVTVACSNTKDKGGLMLAINTDMRAPKDVNVITLSVLVNNQVKVNYQGRVTPDGKVLLPATVALAEPSDPNASIRIRVVAFQERRARVLRDVRTTIPTGGRIALLRLPLNFVEDGSGQGELPVGFVVDDKPISNTGPGGSTTSSSGSTTSSSGTSGTSGGADGGGSTTSSSGGTSSGGTSSGDVGGGDFGSGEFNPYEVVSSSCPVDQTSIHGECKDDYVDSSTLSDYSEDLVGSGDPAKGSCFDVAKAFGNAAPVGQGDSSIATDAGRGSGGAFADADAPAPVDAGSKGADFHLQNVTLDPTACALNLNGADPNNLNIAIVTNDTGECIRPGECYIPIDQGDNGWTAANGRVQLPAFVCTLLNKKGLRLATAEGQPAKKANNPICAATGSESNTPDGGTTNAGATRVFAEAYATAVRVPNQGTVLYFAGSTRIGRYLLTTPDAPPTELAFPDPATRPAGQQPWYLTPTTGGGIVATTETSSTAWAITAADGNTLTTLQVGQTPINDGFDDGSGGFLWAIGGKNGGVFQSVGGEPASRVNVGGVPFPATDVALVATITSDFFSGFSYVDTAGTGKFCNSAQGCTTSLNYRSRVDDYAADPFPPSGSVASSFAVTWYGIQRTDADLTTGGSLGPFLANDATKGIQQASGYYRHGVATAMNHGCLYFTSANGVEWASLDFSQHGVLVPLPQATPALGVATGGGGGTAGSFVYYAVFAPETDGGGIWRVPPPPECPVEVSGGADAGASGSDASTGVDAGF